MGVNFNFVGIYVCGELKESTNKLLLESTSLLKSVCLQILFVFAFRSHGCLWHWIVKKTMICNFTRYAGDEQDIVVIYGLVLSVMHSIKCILTWPLVKRNLLSNVEKINHFSSYFSDSIFVHSLLVHLLSVMSQCLYW